MRDELKVTGALFLFFSSLYFLTAAGRIDIIDGDIRFAVTQSLIEYGDVLVVRGVPRVFGPYDGHPYAYYQLGASVLSVPFVWLARVLSPGSINAEQFAFSLSTVPYAGATVALLYRIYISMGASPRNAVKFTSLVAVGTMLWFYAGSTFDMTMQSLSLTLGIWTGTTALQEGGTRRAWLSGLGFFVLINVQESYVFLILALLLSLLWRPNGWSIGQMFQRRYPEMLRISLGVVLGGCAVLAYNFYRFGDPLDTGRLAAGHPILGNPLHGLRGLLLSPSKSIFLYSPLHVAGLVGLVRLARKRSVLGGTCLVTLLIQLCILCPLTFWAGEWAWGPRYLTATAPLVMIGLPYFVAGASGRVIFRLLACAAVIVQLLSVSVDHQRYQAARNWEPHYWLDDSIMYEDSALFRRPSEILEIARSPLPPADRALVPGIYSPYINDPSGPGLPPRLGPIVITTGPRMPTMRERLYDWHRKFYIFQMFRPWTYWIWPLAEKDRPLQPIPFVILGLLGLFASAEVIRRTIFPWKKRTDG